MEERTDMRKICIIVLLLAFASWVSYAQYTITPNGVTNNTDKEYLVFDIDGKSQEEIFGKAQTFLASHYVSPKNVISHYNDNTITINGETVLEWSNGEGRMTYTSKLNYTITLLVKDGRLRVNNPTINYLNVGGDNGRELWLVAPNLLGVANGIFRPNGKLEKQHIGLKKAIEDYFTCFNKELVEYISHDMDEDW